VPETLPMRLAGLDQVHDLIRVLMLIRSGEASTRPELSRRSGLGRAAISQRISELIDSGLVREGELGPSTGGRPSREVHFRTDAGLLLAAQLGATSINVALTDLNGQVVEHHEEPGDIAAGPEPILGRVEELFDRFVAALPDGCAAIWGIGVGVPGPVEYATGRPVSPPIMPGWDGYDIRGRLSARYRAPVWVDNEVNLMALGELRCGLGRTEQDLIYLKVGTGIGAGLVSGGRLHRGAQGCAGDVGHVAAAAGQEVVCRCGNTGCLEALAGGAALARDAIAAAQASHSPYLRDLLASGKALTARDVSEGAAHGDATSRDLLVRSGAVIGQTLAQLVNFFNPSLIVIGGGVAEAGDVFLAAIRESVYRRSLPLATRDLRITRSPLNHFAGLSGAAAVVTDELFKPDRAAQWIPRRTPHGDPALANQHGADSGASSSAGALA
jgi:glucokinase-like ROK family protein